MKVLNQVIFVSLFGTTITAFSPSASSSSRRDGIAVPKSLSSPLYSMVLDSSSNNEEPQQDDNIDDNTASAGEGALDTIPPSSSAGASAAVAAPEYEMYPVFTNNLETIEGGGTVRTYQMPPWAERVQMYFQTRGRPLKATVELWLGPIRKTHRLEIDIEDGYLFPYMATLKFKKGPQVLQVSTSDVLELPMQAGVSVPSPERSEELGIITENIWANAIPDQQKQIVQGGSTEDNKGGAVRTWVIPNGVDKVQFMVWSRDVGKKSFRTRIEVLQGPNNKRQSFMLQCGGGSQPYHAVLETPGDGWMIRATNLKYLEDGLTQFAVVPYGANTDSTITTVFSHKNTVGVRNAPPRGQPPSAATKPWWQ